MTLGERLRLARERKGLTQKEASKITNINNITISNYEINYRKPTPEKLALLATAYNVTTDYLLGLTNDITQKNTSSFALQEAIRTQYGLTIYEIVNKLSNMSSVEQGKAWGLIEGLLSTRTIETKETG